MVKEIMELKFKFPIIYIRNIKINNFKINKLQFKTGINYFKRKLNA